MTSDLNYICKDIERITPSDSFICSPEASIDHIPKDFCNSLKILHVNIRSVTRNFDDLIVLLHRIPFKTDIIVLSECWLSKSPLIPDISGFDSFKSNFSNQNEGIIVYINKNLEYNIETPIFHDANSIIIKLSDTIAIVALYRSPAYKDISNFIISLDTILLNLSKFKSVALIGDVNINLISTKTDAASDEYLNLLAFHGLLPGHLFPTREENCLDHVILRTTYSAITLVFNSLITDHSPTMLFLNIFNKIQTRNMSPRLIIRTNIPAVVKELSSVDFSKILNSNDPDEAVNELISIIQHVLNNNNCKINIPSRKRIIKPWITPGLLRCIRQRDRLYRKHKRNQTSDTDKLIYIRYRNFCNNRLKKVKREYEREEIQKAKGNSKATWEVIKRIANIEKKKTPSTSLLKLCDDSISSINKINNFFANVGADLANKTTPLNNIGTNLPVINSTHCTVQNSMALLFIDSVEVETTILSLKENCANGWDGISTTLIKAARHVLIPILVKILNLSMSMGIFPTAFKMAYVHPVYKTGDRHTVSNYRPISILTVMSKIFEKLLNRRLVSFLTENNIISHNQFGFMAGKSTEGAVLEITNSIIRNIERRLKTIGIFLDISKAFDTVSVPHLLDKLERIGVRGIANDLFRSYLTNRSQIVTIDNINSSTKNIRYGVPQGSVLGPTLFLIYINELCSMSLVNCKFVTYADDTAIIIHGQNWQEVRNFAENALRHIMFWLSHNSLTLNLSKSLFVPFSPNSSLQPPDNFIIQAHVCPPNCSQCCCANLERKSSVKYLGVWMDSAMCWKQHIANLVARMRKLVYVFRNLRPSLDFRGLKTVYLALAQSILTYCIIVWGGSAKSHMIRLEIAQRAVLKVMSFKPIRFPTIEVYTISEVLNVRQLFILKVIMRKHAQTPYNPELVRSKRRFDHVCQIEAHRTTLASRHYHYISSYLYNCINRKLLIYPLTLNKLKLKCQNWLMSLSYEDSESLLKAPL